VVIPAAACLAVAALLASTSSAVAKSGLVSWQHWDFYTAAQQPVSVQFVWNAQYGGIHFPRKRTRVLEVKAPRRSLYWRAAVLDDFVGDRWVEAPPLRADALEPPGGKLLRQDVQVLALADTHLVGATVPVRYDAGDAPLVKVPGTAELSSGLTRGFRYSVWSEAPQPTPAELARSRPTYPVELTEPGTFLDVGRGITMPQFGLRRLFRPELERYAPLERTAISVAGGAPTPYAAAARLVTWFRTTGGFVYTDRPPSSGATAPLVDFVTRTRAGYCQQFAGAMTLMLRYLGVPARVAVGFSSGTYDARRGVWDVTDHDAHAWVEAWFRGYGWLPFDPTPAARPGRGQLSAPYAAAVEGAGSSAIAGGRAVGAGPNDPRQSGHRHGEVPETGAGGGRAAATGSAPSSHGSLLALLALLVGGAVAVVVLAKLVVRRTRYLTRDPRRIAAACRQELADYLVDQHIESARSATLHELGALVRHELAVEPDGFVAAATAARFGRPAGAGSAARDARRELRALIRAMRVRIRSRDRVRGILSLRSFGLAA
jgi:transglutaminase-like putative cysteine protease